MVDIKSLLPKKLEVLLWVKETRQGIETYCHDDIDKMGNFYKLQLKAFLEAIIKRMK